jgi:four helix bundle protein
MEPKPAYTPEPLILQKKTEVLLNKEIYPVLQKFPKAEKFSLCQEIKQAFYRIIRNTMLANSTKRGDLRITRYNEVDADLKLLLVHITIAREQKYLSERRALQLQERISELGRITGGLIKAANNSR